MDPDDDAWLAAALVDGSDDILAIGMQYLAGQPPVLDGTLQIAGDASYGPLVDGVRQEGSDWNDYLGIDGVYQDGAIVDPPEASQFLSLDCSGYVRMVFGFRAGMPLGPGPDGLGIEIPRRAVQIEASAPGVQTIVNSGAVAPTASLVPGDLVFFDAADDDGTDIDHTGIFLGVDGDGRPRFLSSRKSPDGPTMGDFGGCSCLDGTGTYATSFRSSRRL
jgi:cell wall-associated NlpC family hydrolase